ncbi:MAG: hypothetical protein ACRCY8_19725 [Dermatophilaceae bacterium]
MTRQSDADILRAANLGAGHDTAGQLGSGGENPGDVKFAWSGGSGADAFSTQLNGEVGQHEKLQADLGRGREHIQTFLANTSVSQRRVARGLDHYEIAEQESRALRENNVGRYLSDEAIQQYWVLQNGYTRQMNDASGVVKREMENHWALVDNLQANLGDPVLVAQNSNRTNLPGSDSHIKVPSELPPPADQPQPTPESRTNGKFDNTPPKGTAELPVEANIDGSNPSTINPDVGNVGPLTPSADSFETEVDGVPVNFTIFKGVDGTKPLDYQVEGLTAEERAYLESEYAGMAHGIKERDIAYLGSYNGINSTDFSQAYQDIDLRNRKQALEDNHAIAAWQRWSSLDQGDHLRDAGKDAYELSQARAIDEHERNLLQRYDLALDGQEQDVDRLNESRSFQIGQDLAAESEDDAAARLNQLVEPGKWNDQTQARFDELRKTHSLPEVYRKLEQEFGITSRPADSDWPDSGRTPEQIFGEQYPTTPGVSSGLQQAIDEQRVQVAQSSAQVDVARATLGANTTIGDRNVPDVTRVDAERPVLHHISPEEAKEFIEADQRTIQGLNPVDGIGKFISPLDDIPVVKDVPAAGRSQAQMNYHAEVFIDAAGRNYEIVSEQQLEDARLVKERSEQTNEETYFANQNNDRNEANNIENTNRSIEQTRDQGLDGDRTTAQLGQENREVTQELHGYGQEYADRTHTYNLELREASQQSGYNEEAAEDLSTRLRHNQDQLSDNVRQIYQSVQHDYYEYAASVRTEEIDYQVQQAFDHGTISKEEYESYQRLVHRPDVDGGGGLTPEVKDRPTGDRR